MTTLFQAIGALEDCCSRPFLSNDYKLFYWDVDHQSCVISAHPVAEAETCLCITTGIEYTENEEAGSVLRDFLYLYAEAHKDKTTLILSKGLFILTNDIHPVAHGLGSAMMFSFAEKTTYLKSLGFEPYLQSQFEAIYKVPVYSTPYRPDCTLDEYMQENKIQSQVKAAGLPFASRKD